MYVSEWKVHCCKQPLLQEAEMGEELTTFQLGCSSGGTQQHGNNRISNPIPYLTSFKTPRQVNTRCMTVYSRQTCVTPTTKRVTPVSRHVIAVSKARHTLQLGIFSLERTRLGSYSNSKCLAPHPHLLGGLSRWQARDSTKVIQSGSRQALGGCCTARKSKVHLSYRLAGLQTQTI